MTTENKKDGVVIEHPTSRALRLRERCDILADATIELLAATVTLTESVSCTPEVRIARRWAIQAAEAAGFVVPAAAKGKGER